MRLVKTSVGKETAAFLHIPADVSVPSVGSSLAGVRSWLRVCTQRFRRWSLLHADMPKCAADHVVLTTTESETASSCPQALESRVNWACWAITQELIRPQDLMPPRDGNVRHVLPAARSFLAQIPAPGDPRALDPFIGCEADVRSLSERILELLHQVWHGRTHACRLQPSRFEPSS